MDHNELVTSRAAWWWAWSLGAVCVVLAVVGSVLAVIGDPTLNDLDYGVSFHVVFLVFAALGVVVALRRPGNTIGWLLLVSGLLWELAGVLAGYAYYSLFAEPGSLPGGTYAAWVLSWLWIPTLGIVPFLFLLFPDGQVAVRSLTADRVAGRRGSRVDVRSVDLWRRARWRTPRGPESVRHDGCETSRWRLQRPPETLCSPWRSSPRSSW